MTLDRRNGGKPGRGLRRAGAALVCAVLCLATGASVRAQLVRQLTDVPSGFTSIAAIDDAGTAVFAIGSTDPYGTNPRHRHQIFRWDPATGVGQQVTSFDKGVEPLGVLSVTDDGLTLVFVSRGDLTGDNPDGSPELFVMNEDGTGLLQLTDSPSPRDGEIGPVFGPGPIISGSGNRVLFLSDIDHTGGNPEHHHELYIVDSDGTNLRQLTDFNDAIYGAAISDDGERVTFAWFDIWAIEADGTGLRNLTNFGFSFSTLPQISGDGSTIAFQTDQDLPNEQPGWCFGGEQIAVVDWDGTGLKKLSGHCAGDAAPGSAGFPDITDDGQVIVYAGVEFGNQDVYKVNRDATGTTDLTDVEFLCRGSRVAGSGSRVAFSCEGGEPFGGSNPDLGSELYAMTASGTDHRQLSDGADGNTRHPDITPDGTRVVFASDANPLAEPPPAGFQLYRVAPDGSDLVRLTAFTSGEIERPAVTDDGQTIVFLADADPLGGNAYRSDELFAVQADGSGLVQLTPDTEGNFDDHGAPDISGDGSLVVFHTPVDLAGAGNFTDSVYRVDPDGTDLSELVPSGSNPRIDASATWVVYESGSSVFRIRTDGTGEEQIGPSAGGSSRLPDVSADGTRIVYQSSGDPLGSNADGNVEIFLYDVPGATTTQLTDTTEGDNEEPSITPDGNAVFFRSSSPHFEIHHGNPADLLRVDVATGVLRRVEALEPCLEARFEPRPIVPDHDGRLAVFAGGRDCVGRNPDGRLELFVVDEDGQPRISPSPGTDPTRVSWPPEAGPVRYDVIRGDVANLASGGGPVDLGPVACLEDDSPDADTAGFEDALQPVPGQVLFHLYRGSQGVDDGPGTYGQGTDGGERVPLSGDCPG